MFRSRLPGWRPSKPASFVGLYDSNFDRQRESQAINNQKWRRFEEFAARRKNAVL
jgi:hypothetical protein